MSPEASLGCACISEFSWFSWQWQFWEVLIHCFVNSPTTGIRWFVFLMITTEGVISWLSLLMSTLTTFDVVFVRLLNHKVIPIVSISTLCCKFEEWCSTPLRAQYYIILSSAWRLVSSPELTLYLCIQPLISISMDSCICISYTHPPFAPVPTCFWHRDHLLALTVPASDCWCSFLTCSLMGWIRRVLLSWLSLTLTQALCTWASGVMLSSNSSFAPCETCSLPCVCSWCEGGIVYFIFNHSRPLLGVGFLAWDSPQSFLSGEVSSALPHVLWFGACALAGASFGDPLPPR